MEVLMRKETINEYDLVVCKERIQELLIEYIRIKYAYSNIRCQGKEFYDSSTGANYEYRPEMATIKYSDRVGSKVCFKIDNEREVNQMEYDISQLYNRFTETEKDYFDIVLLSNRPEKIVEDKYGLSRTGFFPIKNSCILKTALYFEIAKKR